MKLTMLRRKMLMLAIEEEEEIKNKNVAENEVEDDVGAFARLDFARACASRLEDFTRSTLHGNIRKLKGKMPEPRTATHTLCEPWQSTCVWTFHTKATGHGN